ncbi:lysophospholipid acyltransferase family protein [Paludisphaera mucosa]|uniref:Lysophospholipid acyltransferase family protein n=1 Tax=Paludisphaera mucosa TaxID=3030827 RepID=A0ABT6F7W8_9BACT|nr:lysophospholipid acyltransferase family protein [Paludisphaera mucosa]MDG3003508.1 lysophospholipid acyltransferase family protein [Paludisphaera mucosa]
MARPARVELKANAQEARPPGSLPRRSAWFFRGFRKYARRYVAKNFHALRVDRDGLPTDPPPGPAIVVMSHASWWDPMIGLILSESFGPSRAHYAPMDEEGLKQYPILERVGIFGVELETARGGIAFLRRSSAVLTRPESMLWVTPQGRFVDVRERPIRFKQGIGRLLHRTSHASVVPLAVEYPFWNDRRPEVLARFGAWISIEERVSLSAKAWTKRLETSLGETQDRLAESSLGRDPGRFQTVVRGSSGVGGVYDLGRRLRSAFRGESFTSEHLVEQPSHGPRT